MKFIYAFCICLTCLLHSENSNAQSKWKSFCKLSCPEKWWTIQHIFVAGKAFKITKDVREATTNVLADSILDLFPNGGKTDAFRHGYWMASLTKVIGEKRAKSLGIAHEKGNYREFLKGKLEDGFRADSIAGIMDQKNNLAGISLGLKNKNASAVELKNIIITAIQRGEFYILKRNSNQELVNCNGEIVIPNSSWFLPYCLVSSNLSP